MEGNGGPKALRDRGARLRRRYQRSFVACVDKYDKMSSLRDSGGCRGFQMIIVCPLRYNELLQGWGGTRTGCIYRPVLSTENEDDIHLHIHMYQ